MDTQPIQSAAWLYGGELSLGGASDSSDPLKYSKDVLTCGHWVHPTQKNARGGQFEFDVTPDDLKTIVAGYNEMSAIGDEPPIVMDHKENSESTLGYMKGLAIDGDRIRMNAKFGDVQSRDIALRNKVSVKLVRNHRISNGKILPLAITHVSTTPRPVITQQNDWAIAAARGSECDETPVLFLTASTLQKDSNMLDEKTMKRIKAIAPNATDDDAVELLLSTAETEHARLAEKTTAMAKATERLASLEKLPGAIELSTARKTELVENIDNFIEVSAIKSQWPQACTDAIKSVFKGDDGLLLSREADGGSRARKIIETIAPFIGKGLAVDKERTIIQLSRVATDDKTEPDPTDFSKDPQFKLLQSQVKAYAPAK